MRIGIVSAKIGFNDGQGRVNYEIAAAALRRGHELILFCEQIDAELAGRKNVAHVLLSPPRWLPTRLLRDQLFALRSYRRIAIASNASAPQAQRCDAILANGFTTWAAADVNAVHFVHSSWLRSKHHAWRLRRTFSTAYKALYNALNALLERGAFARSPVIVAVSEKIREELIGIGVAPAAVSTIVNGVDSDEFRPGSADRARFGLPLGPVIALFAGDLNDSRKNLDSVLNALGSVPALHLAVAGRHEHTDWPALAAKLGVADRVHFLGFRRDMPELMRAVDLFVFPSRYEACALVFLEALASGLPVITARSAGGAELVTPEVGIVLEDSEDIASLGRALNSLTFDGRKRAAMRVVARSQALEHSWATMAGQYIDLLEAAAGNVKLEAVAGERSACQPIVVQR